MRLLVFLILLVASLSPPFCAARDVAVITDKSNASSALTGPELQKLFKNGTTEWPDGKKVKIVLCDPDSADGQLVLQKIYKMTAEDIRAFVRAHKDNILLLASDEQVLKAVADMPGAIGVVNVYSLSSAVKVIRVDGKLPLEQGYLLHGR